MPYPNEHSCRLVDPNEFKGFRRKNAEEFEGNKSIDVVYGIRDKKGKRGGKSEIQALRYDKDIWSVGEAAVHCEIRGGRFEPAKGIAFIGRPLPPKRKHSISNESPAKLTLTHDLEHSAMEENLAARAYRQRAKTAKTEGDEKSAKLFEHIAGEEDVHEKEFKTRSKQI